MNKGVNWWLVVIVTFSNYVFYFIKNKQRNYYLKLNYVPKEETQEE